MQDLQSHLLRIYRCSAVDCDTWSSHLGYTKSLETTTKDMGRERRTHGATKAKSEEALESAALEVSEEEDGRIS